MAGLVRKYDIDKGVIDHVVACAYDQPAGTFVYPASKSDGGSTITNDMPEGALLKLKDSFPVQDIQDATARMFATAAQQYGLIIADNSGTSKTYWEADESVNYYAGTSGTFWNGALVNADFLREIPINEFICVDPNGTSATRESDIRIDLSKAADPLASAPTVLRTKTATGAAVSSLASGALAALNTDELVVAIINIKGSNGQYVSGVTGTNGVGGTWRKLQRTIEYKALGQNLVQEVWWTRATSGTAGSVTATFNGSQSTATIQVLCHTVGAAIRSKSSKCGSSATPSIKLRATTASSLIVGSLLTRNTTTTFPGGVSAVEQITAGSGGNIIYSNVGTLAGGGDVTFAPTTAASIEWIGTLYEVT